MPLLLLDFDGTITQNDTLHPLVTLAISSSSASLALPAAPGPTSTTSASPPPSNPPTTEIQEKGHPPQNVDLHARWSQIVNDYVADHAAHLASYVPAAEARTTLAQELAFLESLGDVERRSVERVGKAGFFRGLMDPGSSGGSGTAAGEEEEEGPGVGGLRLDGLGSGVGTGNVNEGSAGKRVSRKKKESALQRLGREAVRRKEVEVRKGFDKFIKDVKGRQPKWEVAVVSVNWSGDFIRGVVDQGCGEVIAEEKVVANQVASPDGWVEGPAELGGEVLATAGDKLRGMESLRNRGEKVVYFGDSTTDLACLVEADLGVVIADDGESKVLRTMRRVGLAVPHVGDADAGSRLVWAKDFEEVAQSKVMDWV
ncbi:hypothetical protein VTK26DRAFT_8580 [Humicola hyalothermophila]